MTGGHLSPLRLVLSLVVLVGPSAVAGQGDTTPAAARLFRIEVNHRSGYIDATGRTIIPPRFEESGPFAEGLAPVRVEGKWGFIDATGTFVIAPRFAGAAGFSQGLAPVNEDGKWGYIDQTGAWVIRPQFFAAWRFSEGLAAVATACRPDPNVSSICFPDKQGYVDRTGRMVIQPRFHDASTFAQGRAAVDLVNTTGFIDSTGTMVFEAQWASRSVPKFADGRAPVRIGNTWGYIDRTGRVVIEPAFAAAMGFSEQRAAVFLDDKWGFIDTTGAIAIAPQLYFALPFSEGLAPVKASAQTWGYVDRSGRMVIEPRPYVSASGFQGGLAQVQDRDGFHYIDRTGNTVWSESRATVAEHPIEPADTTPLGGTGSLVDRVAAVVDRAEAAERGQPVDRPDQIMADVTKAATQLAAHLNIHPDDVRALILSVRLGRFREVAEPVVTGGGRPVPTFATLAAAYAPHHASLNHALALEPNNAEVHYWKARLYGLSHDWIGMLYGISEVPPAEDALARAYADSAVRFGRRAVELAPERVPYREALAIYLILSDREPEAATVLQPVAGGHHPMSALLADWAAIPLPAGAVPLRGQASGMARTWMEEGSIKDYPFLRVRMYVVRMPADSVQAFYRTHWAGFRFLLTEHQEMAAARMRSFGQYIRWQDGRVVAARDTAQIPDEPTEGVIISLIEIANPPTEVRRQFPVPLGSVFCSLSFIDLRSVTSP